MLASDAQLRVGRNDIVTLQAAASTDTTGRASASSLLGRWSWERRAADGFAYELHAKATGHAYEPDIGFEPRAGRTHLGGAIRHTLTAQRGRAWHEIKTGFEWASYFRNRSWGVESASNNLYLQAVLPSGASALVEGELDAEDVIEPLPLGPAVSINPGYYRDRKVLVRYSPPPVRRARADVWMSSGTLYGGRQVVIGVSPALTVNRHLELGIDAERNRTRFAGQPELNGDVGRIRASAALNVKLSADLGAQYLSTTKALYLNGRLRLNLAEGRDLFLVYRENQFDESIQAGPRQRRLLIKIAHRFDPR